MYIICKCVLLLGVMEKGQGTSSGTEGIGCRGYSELQNNFHDNLGIEASAT